LSVSSRAPFEAAVLAGVRAPRTSSLGVKVARQTR